VVDAVVAAWGSGSWNGPAPGSTHPHEARFLKLDCSKAADSLGWRPVWGGEEGIRSTVRWYRALYLDDADPCAITLDCLTSYIESARRAGLTWAG
jgi:CDP-glucose 4,6-dehydratase